jgi:hypothetical protein
MKIAHIENTLISVDCDFVKRQTRNRVRESALYQQTDNFLTVIMICS